MYEALSYCCRPLLLQAPAECPWLLQPYQTHALQEAVAYVSMRQHACLVKPYEIAATSVLLEARGVLGRGTG